MAYIVKEDLLAEAKAKQGGIFAAPVIVRLIQKAPEIDIYKLGKWNITEDFGECLKIQYVEAKCSICGHTDVFGERGFYKYCPECGAKMKGGRTMDNGTYKYNYYVTYQGEDKKGYLTGCEYVNCDTKITNEEGIVILRDYLKEKCNLKSVIILNFKEMETTPDEDEVKVVRCKNCKHWGGVVFGYRCRKFSGMNTQIQTSKNDFCSFGERKEGIKNE